MQRKLPSAAAAAVNTSSPAIGEESGYELLACGLTAGSPEREEKHLQACVSAASKPVARLPAKMEEAFSSEMAPFWLIRRLAVSLV